MEFLISTRNFLWGIIKRFYFLIPSLFTDPFDFMERWFGIVYTPPPYLFWVLLGLGVFIAGLFAYHELGMQSLKLKSEVSDKTKSITITPRDKRGDIIPNINVVSNLCSQMRTLHGAEDYDGIKRDVRDGIDINVILSRKCTICGEPRNQWKASGH